LAINFLGTNCLVMTDAYTKSPRIHSTSSVSSKATTDLLERISHPHTIVSDNGPAFASEEFQQWCIVRGITHLTGAPHHPATNGAAERLVQSFKPATKKSEKSKEAALQEFLMQYRKTSVPHGFSPSELLNGRQLRAKIDTPLPSPPHLAQGLQMQAEKEKEAKKNHSYDVGAPCYALYYGPRRTRNPDGSQPL